jgi:biopolymer transport protein ExbB
MKTFNKIMLLMITLAGIAWPGIASAWWNDDWSYRVAVHLDTSPTGAGVFTTQSEVPVLVRLHTGNFQDFFLLKEDLADLRFIGGDDKTPLKFHVESFDLLNQLLFVWVKVPQVTGSLNTEQVWMYYGNEKAVAASDATGTYDVNSAMVHHFQAGSNLLNDETAYANRFVTSAGVPEPASLIGAGMRFTGEGGVSLPASTATQLVPANGITVSFWVKPDDSSSAVLFSHNDGRNEIKVMNNADKITARLVSADGAEYVTQPVAGFSPGAWHQITLVVSASKLTLYMNGIEGSAVAAKVPEISGQIIFGADVNGNLPFRGVMDEIEYSNIVRSADYIKLLASNQGMGDTLLTVSEAEQLGSGGGSESHFAFVMSRLTFDAKVVIVFLLLMSVISWIVMVMKWFYLNRVAKDNKRFLAAYYALGTDDPAKLDHKDSEEDKALEDSPVTQALFGNHDHFQSSPLYHMYHRGISEVKARVGTSVGAQAVAMTSQSAEAIRATLDADMVRGTQKLNSKMVLLTIAISGGPFIGLLGTVIGVMITFAEMASTGDVNIASIAPGMAAALMATIAGLWVAIPALFGYNYLSSTIKNITADMHVFIDEFVTRVAEYYGR